MPAPVRTPLFSLQVTAKQGRVGGGRGSLRLREQEHSDLSGAVTILCLPRPKVWQGYQVNFRNVSLVKPLPLFALKSCKRMTLLKNNGIWKFRVKLKTVQKFLAYFI